MAWERRQHGGLYYTRSRRVGGRVHREYIGGGEWGAAMAAIDEADRSRRESERVRWQEELEKLGKIDLDFEEGDTICVLLMKDALEIAGFHQHHRGEWRRCREEKGEETS